MSSKRYGKAQFGLPTHGQIRSYSLLVSLPMLVVTSLLHYTDPGQDVYEKILNPGSTSQIGTPSGGGPVIGNNPNQPTGPVYESNRGSGGNGGGPWGNTGGSSQKPTGAVYGDNKRNQNNTPKGPVYGNNPGGTGGGFGGSQGGGGPWG